MKIQEIGAQQQINGADPAARRREAGAESFAGVLEQEASKGSAASGSIQPIDQPGLIAAVLKTETAADPAVQKSCINAADGVLAKLEALSNLLQQPDANPKEIDGLLSDLKVKAAGLQEKISGLPAGDPLADIGNEANTLAYLESVKWQRGDYLS
jgi:hypothetical protein